MAYLSGLSGDEYDACLAQGGQRLPGTGSCPPGRVEWQYNAGRCCLPAPAAPAPAAAPANVTVSPVIQTQVSPQVSPVFQQAWQPQGPMVAGTTQQAASPQSANTDAELARIKAQAEEAQRARDFELQKLKMQQEAQAKQQASWDAALVRARESLDRYNAQSSAPVSSAPPPLASTPSPIVPATLVSDEQPSPVQKPAVAAPSTRLPLLVGAGAIMLVVLFGMQTHAAKRNT